jgi:plasmid maintenance system killer protein
MEVTFANARLHKLCNSASKLRGEYGPRMAAVIQQRLYELSAAETLADMLTVVGAHCHALTQNLKGLYAVHLVQPNRLAFKPAHDPIPLKPDKGVDLVRVTAVEVVGIGDYHPSKGN